MLMLQHFIMYDIETIVKKLKVKDSRIVRNDVIERFLTDSRSLTIRENTVFIAFRTNTDDGHRYIGQLYEHGVTNFIISQPLSSFASLYPEANFVEVLDTLQALQKLAKEWRSAFDIPVVGITGSNGKTVIKEFMYQLLSPFYNIVRSPRSYNSQLGVPLSVLKMKENHDLAIFEAGISEPGEMIKLADIIQPTVGIFTNIGSAHQERFNSLAHKIDEKMLLFASCDRVVYNADDPNLVKGIETAGLQARAFGWSMQDRSASLYVEIFEQKDVKTLIRYYFLGMSNDIVIPFTDKASIENCIHCIASILVTRPALMEQCKDRFAVLEPVEMRLEVKLGDRGNYIINDAYNNDINSLRIALDYQQRRTRSDGHKRVLILSEILQSSVRPRELYREVSSMLQEYGCDLLIGVGRELCSHRDLFTMLNASFFVSTEELLLRNPFASLEHCSILIKGARKFHFEKVVKSLTKQVHETVLEVNLEAVRNNLRYYKSLLPQETRFITMIKAQGYGIGSVELAKVLEQEHVEALAVAVADEGRELRSNGVLTPIIVMNPEQEAFDTIISYHLEPEIYSFSLLERFRQRIDKEGFTQYPVHIEIDTGMHRLGFLPNEIEHLAREINSSSVLKVRSVFMHLAAADAPGEDAFTLRQIELFQEATQKLQSLIGYAPLRHVLNTAGMERFPQYHFDMVRLGIGLYGVSATGGAPLDPICRLRTIILQIKEIPQGESVGYGRRGHLEGVGRIGIIPIGYADGYDRRFSCGVGLVSVGGVLCPTVGNICMDTTMIDLTGVEAQEGDEVVVFGSAGVDYATMAQRIGTIPYEIMSQLAPRVQRVYYRGE